MAIPQTNLELESTIRNLVPILRKAFVISVAMLTLTDTQIRYKHVDEITLAQNIGLILGVFLLSYIILGVLFGMTLSYLTSHFLSMNKIRADKLYRNIGETLSIIATWFLVIQFPSLAKSIGTLGLIIFIALFTLSPLIEDISEDIEKAETEIENARRKYWLTFSIKES